MKKDPYLLEEASNEEIERGDYVEVPPMGISPMNAFGDCDYVFEEPKKVSKKAYDENLKTEKKQRECSCYKSYWRIPFTKATVVCYCGNSFKADKSLPTYICPSCKRLLIFD